jgi:hypothetical protein
MSAENDSEVPKLSELSKIRFTVKLLIVFGVEYGILRILSSVFLDLPIWADAIYLTVTFGVACYAALVMETMRVYIEQQNAKEAEVTA